MNVPSVVPPSSPVSGSTGREPCAGQRTISILHSRDRPRASHSLRAPPASRRSRASHARQAGGQVGIQVVGDGRHGNAPGMDSQSPGQPWNPSVVRSTKFTPARHIATPIIHRCHRTAPLAAHPDGMAPPHCRNRDRRPRAAWLAQDGLIFFPQPVASTAHLPAHATPFSVTATDGTRLHGWIAAARESGAGDPLLRRQRRGGLAYARRSALAARLVDRRDQLPWLWHQRRFAGRARAHVRRALDLRRRHGREDVDRNRIVVFGRSLGTAVAARVAAERPVAGVVLVSPFDSLAAIGNHHYPWLPVSLLLRHRFEARADAVRGEAPMLAIVADSDTIIPVERSRALYEAWAGPKSWQVVPGAITTRWVPRPTSGAASRGLWHRSEHSKGNQGHARPSNWRA